MIDTIISTTIMTKPDSIGYIYIIAAKNYYHEALSYIIEREIGAKCLIVPNCDAIQQELKNGDKKRLLIFINYLEKEFEKELLSLGFHEKEDHDSTFAALFNLQRGTQIEKRAFNKGIKGFFYRDDNLSHMIKGLQALLNGEIWLSREILVEVALKKGAIKAGKVRDKTALTDREMEILALVSIGSGNDQIAEKLFISPLTVKTHLYKIFQKINVPNRLQAALWAAKNL
jgi:DNA-binding CsgD family transcriptional regulator